MILHFYCLLTGIYDFVTVRNKRYNRIVKRYQNGRDKCPRDCRLSIDEQVCICFSNFLLFPFHYDFSMGSCFFIFFTPLLRFQVAQLPIRYAVISLNCKYRVFSFRHFCFNAVGASKTIWCCYHST
jgi:hypothetical protein